jgi:hypothetical protein
MGTPQKIDRYAVPAVFEGHATRPMQNLEVPRGRITCFPIQQFGSSLAAREVVAVSSLDERL